MLIEGESPAMERVLVSSSKPGKGKWFESLWEEQELADVTLVCRDGSQLVAHKTVLALSSPLLRTILTRSKSAGHPVLLLLTTDALLLEKLLRLIYFGEVSLPSDQLDNLLSAAQDLQLSLLQDQLTTHDDTSTKDQQPEWKDTAKGGEAVKQDLKPEVKGFAEKENKSNKAMEPDLTALHSNQGLDKKIGLGKLNLDELAKDSRISRVQMGPSSDGNDCGQQVNQQASCNECDKEFEAFNHLWVHIQAVHRMRHLCKNCGKRYASAGILNQHVDSAHNGIHLVCQDCGKKFNWQATLNKHIRNKHST